MLGKACLPRLGAPLVACLPREPAANFTPRRGAVVRPVSFKGIFLRRRESHRKEITED